ncbi:MAG: CoA-binding protein [archaeon]
MRNLEKMFNPKSIAIFGASDKANSVGYSLAINLSKYKDVYYINPRIKSLFSKKVYASIKEIPARNLDLAVIAIPNTAVAKVLEDLKQVNCKNVVLITSGFSEINNSTLTSQIEKIIKKEKVNLIGPNCFGIVNLEKNLNATFNSNSLALPKCGNISIISQSGALGSCFLDLLSNENLSLNKFISYGNSMDLDESDLLEYLANDKKTQVIVCYIEGVKNGKKFYEVLNKITKTKKVIILKGGRTISGTSAAKSHTAAIAGSCQVFKSVVKQAGAYYVTSISEMFNLAKIFSIYPKLEIKNIQIISNGGGFGVIAIDSLSENKVELSKLSEDSKKQIKSIVPLYASIANPLDLTGDADNERFVKAIEICLKDKNISSIGVLFLFQLSSITKDIIPLLTKLRDKYSTKPIFIIGTGGDKTESMLKAFEKNNFVCFKDPKDLAESLGLIK